MNNNIISNGFARALNKVGVDSLEPGMMFSVPIHRIKEFLIVAETVCNGGVIQSLPGKTYHWLTGMDVTISVQSEPEPDCILIPAHIPTLKLWIEMFPFYHCR